jgi:Pin2-interacting protein X1
MTIVSGPDKRNAAWASDKSAFGQKMLMKMGWSEGKGLGKNQQGTNNNLRAIRREEGLGIGAKTDTFGDDGFSKTSKNFHGVLANLHAEHGTNGNDKSSKKSKKKKKDKTKSGSSNSNSLTLSQNKVTAGHARKMRDSKDLTKKSKEDMAAIFGMKVDEYQSNSVWGRLSSLTSTSASDENVNKTKDDSDADEKKTRRKEKKKKRKKDETDQTADEVEIRKEKKKKRKKDETENTEDESEMKKKSKQSKKRQKKEKES